MPIDGGRTKHIENSEKGKHAVRMINHDETEVLESEMYLSPRVSETLR